MDVSTATHIRRAFEKIMSQIPWQMYRSGLSPAPNTQWLGDTIIQIAKSVLSSGGSYGLMSFGLIDAHPHLFAMIEQTNEPSQES